MMPMNEYAKASFSPVNKCGAALGKVMRRTSCTRDSRCTRATFRITRGTRSRPARVLSIIAGAANITPMAINGSAFKPNNATSNG